MSEEEKAQLLSSDAFLRFLERSSRIIERAICHPDEGIFLDYSGQDLKTKENRVFQTYTVSIQTAPYNKIESNNYTRSSRN
ncbi:unnamed protein product [Schistosoma margrebowiei]|uniref:Uncharacterized protein n=1 Tax=Schistosoma margrebowiei TaxID=48269 RepID=A0A183MY38_9TREM|nr:unnamed protein product [Schistosoma margrebowiei]